MDAIQSGMKRNMVEVTGATLPKSSLLWPTTMLISRIVELKKRTKKNQKILTQIRTKAMTGAGTGASKDKAGEKREL